MFIEKQMDKEDVVQVYSGMSLSLLKKWNWVSGSDMNEPRGCHTEWSKSEIEKQISYINAYIWNLETWYWWICLQAAVEMQTYRTDLQTQAAEEGEGEMSG